MAEGITAQLQTSTDKSLPNFRAEHGEMLLKKGIWVYFFLIIFEGALRKWFLPSLATPLLIIRDPVAVWLLYTAWKYDRFPSNIYISGIYFAGILGFFTTMLVGHGNLFVAIYGERILLLHFPLIFLIANTFDQTDVVKMGRVFMWIAIPMVVIVALQFYTPQSSFFNRGIGGEGSSGFSGANGFFRPSGTFSFTTGLTEFYTVIAAFVVYFLLNENKIKRWVLIGGGIALMAAIPLSISRTLSFQIALTAVFTLIAALKNQKYLTTIIGGAVTVVVLFFVLNEVGVFGTAVDTLVIRFTDANESEGGIVKTLTNRTIANVDEPYLGDDFPFFGMGIGMGTNAGARILVGRSDKFLVSEGEWGRLVGEMGSILGTFVLLIRIAICFKILVKGYQALKFNNILPWLLLSVDFQLISQGQWAQPTALGFAILFAGLNIAAFKTYEPDVKSNFN
ncbi:hypothetical protein ACFQZS_11550 [Mucilaginibacter calamicampi]|uniref:O-antigen ligase n=1 Tax=Mucilaginibacter calamicampi TaxID=1302352 RepID=A0ABW2YY71_9SPHI